MNLKDKPALFKSAHVEWGTPPDLRADLDREFHFTLDPCRPDQIWDGREISWIGHRVFCNPPYGGGKRNRIEPWLLKAREAELAVYLLPSRTGTAWFHDYGLQADEIRFFRGRLRFFENHRIAPDDHSGRFAPFDSLLLIFRSFI
jgi:DNA N-6-adenine-methyltransferase (Dam)